MKKRKFLGKNSSIPESPVDFNFDLIKNINKASLYSRVKINKNLYSVIQKLWYFS